MNWWRNDTDEKYNAKSKCFEEQYSAYETAAGDQVSTYLYGLYIVFDSSDVQ